MSRIPRQQHAAGDRTILSLSRERGFSLQMNAKIETPGNSQHKYFFPEGREVVRFLDHPEIKIATHLCAPYPFTIQNNELRHLSRFRILCFGFGHRLFRKEAHDAAQIAGESR